MSDTEDWEDCEINMDAVATTTATATPALPVPAATATPALPVPAVVGGATGGESDDWETFEISIGEEGGAEEEKKEAVKEVNKVVKEEVKKEAVEEVKKVVKE